MMSKREAVRAILDGKGADRIPVIMTIGSFAMARYGYGPEALFNPPMFAECISGTSDQLGLDGLCGGICTMTAGDVAGHLPTPDGNVSGDGQNTIRSVEDLEKLAPFNVKESVCVKSTCETIRILREKYPDEPIWIIVYAGAGVAFELLGARYAFKIMTKKPELFRAVAEYCEDMQYQVAEALWEAGADYLWYPEPNFGGACISRRAYQNCISESNIRFFKRLQDAGIRFLLHTCGPYDDRFDLVLKEGAGAWHISETKTKKVKEEYGDQVSLMGSIPSIPVLLEGTEEEVYQFAYQECMDGARDGRFILSGDCDVPPSVSDENLRAVVRAARDAEKVLFGD